MSFLNVKYSFFAHQMCRKINQDRLLSIRTYTEESDTIIRFVLYSFELYSPVLFVHFNFVRNFSEYLRYFDKELIRQFRVSISSDKLLIGVLKLYRAFRAIRDVNVIT